ncbi:UNVERIFIED_CONTAM: hypothetical protein H355_000432 [Colinus virginianus]|nr:hypothetical protein H355_000432 [Colinus virginianus]
MFLLAPTSSTDPQHEDKICFEWICSHNALTVPDEYFAILLDYLQGLKGSARDTTVQKSEALMQELDGSDAEDPSAMEKCERIRQVLQLLS